MLTKEEVALWMQANPREAAELCLRFQLGSAAGMLMANCGLSVDDVRATLEDALRAVPLPKVEAPS